MNINTNSSYSNLFMKKKELATSKERSKPKNIKKTQNNSNSYINQSEQELYENPNYLNYNTVQNDYDNAELFDHQHKQFQQHLQNKNIPPQYPVNGNPKEIRHINYNQNNLRAKSSNSESMDLSNLSQDRVLSPKSHYKFNNSLLQKCASSDKIKSAKAIQKSRHNSSIESGTTSVNPYLQRRHVETLDRMNKIRNENLKKEQEQMRKKPQISKNSKKIVEKLVNNDQNVFDRLTSKVHDRKKAEEINKIEEIHKISHKPKVYYI